MLACAFVHTQQEGAGVLSCPETEEDSIKSYNKFGIILQKSDVNQTICFVDQRRSLM